MKRIFNLTSLSRTNSIYSITIYNFLKFDTLLEVNQIFCHLKNLLIKIITVIQINIKLERKLNSVTCSLV